MQNMHSIYINARFVTQPLTGVQRYAFECCLQMKKLNPDIVFLCPKNGSQQAWSSELEVSAIGSFTGHLWEQIDLLIYFSSKKNYTLFNPCNTAPLLLKHNYITVHDVSYALFKENNSFVFTSWYNFLLPRIIVKAKHVFTVSETVKKQLIELYETTEGKISITYNGLARKFLNNPAQAHAKEKIILSLGSFSKRKNTEMLVEAFLDSTLLHDYTLVILGGYYKAFSKTQLTKSDRILLIEKPSDEALVSYYQRAQIFVSLSMYEGFGLPVLEALHFNCSVLCADIQTYHELFDDYVYFCNHFNKMDIMHMLHNIAQLNTIEERHITALIKKYSFEKSAAHILSIINGNKID